MAPTEFASGLDTAMHAAMNWLCPLLDESQVSPTDPLLLKHAMRECDDTPERLSTTRSPYSESYSYCGVNANAMYYYGGDSVWGNTVRGCLSCMDEFGVAPHDAHMFCYGEATERTSSFWGTAQGYGEAVLEAALDIASTTWEKAKSLPMRAFDWLFG